MNPTTDPRKIDPRKIDDFVAQVREAIATDQLALPSLPDIALKIRSECEKPDASVDTIADALYQDPALCVRLLQLANSALYRTRHAAENMHMAITRLGLRLVRDLVIGLAMKQLYEAGTEVLRERFRELWLASIKTAALAHILARRHEHLDPEQAMLTGLTHNIGALPILMLAEYDTELMDSPGALRQIIHRTQGEAGASIFRAWNFPDHMAEVALHCYNFDRHHHGPADYLDVVQAALVQSSIYTGLDCPEDWSIVPAFEKLDIDTGAHMLEIDENKLMYEETQSLFK